MCIIMALFVSTIRRKFSVNFATNHVSFQPYWMLVLPWVWMTFPFRQIVEFQALIVKPNQVLLWVKTNVGVETMLYEPVDRACLKAIQTVADQMKVPVEVLRNQALYNRASTTKKSVK
jgi:hypothetical protein